MYGEIRFLSKYKKSGGTRVSLEYDTMYDYITQGAINLVRIRREK